MLKKSIVITCAAYFLLAAIGSANAAQSKSTMPLSSSPQTQTANQALLDGAEIFENLAESALTVTQEQYNAAMADYARHSDAINKALMPDYKKQFVLNINSLKNNWTKGSRTEVALSSVEAYRLLVESVKPAPGILPVQVALLDYSGFKMSALAHGPSPDWNAIGNTAMEAANWWKVVAPQVHDRNLKQAMQRTIEAYAYVTKTRNVALLIYSADMDLILVDALEEDMSRAKIKK